MNIFALSTDPQVAARMVCDVHSNKMCLESAQMMASVLRRYGASDEDFLAYDIVTKAGKPYGNAHPNHPCTLWAGETFGNWEWLVRHAQELLNQFYSRYGGKHACHDPIHGMRRLMAKCRRAAMQDAWVTDLFFAKSEKTPFVMAMPDEFKRDDGKEVLAYRAYYKSKVFKNGKKPSWEKGVAMPSWYAQPSVYDDADATTLNESEDWTDFSDILGTWEPLGRSSSMWSPRHEVTEDEQ